MARTLRIVSINDVYSLENLPRMKTLAHHFRSMPADKTLVILAGDFLAPSLLSSLDAGRGMVDCLNDIGITHVVLGNHEDDVSVDELHRRIAEFRGVWVSTNAPFDPKMVRRDVIDVAGLRVGLVGVVMVDEAVYRNPPFGGCATENANAAAIREAAALVADGCACVVPITHQSIADDRALAHADVHPAFPVIIGGHEHTPYVERDGATQTWIVKAGADAAAAVITELVWDDANVLTTTARLEPVKDYAEDAELRARVDRHMAKVHEIETASLVMLTSGETLSSVGARANQTSLGALLCSRIRDALGVDACLFNAGGVRGAREYKTHFTYGDLKTEVPFDNEIVVVRMPGRVIRDAVAASRAHAPEETGAFLQIDDHMSATNNVVTMVAGAPLDEARDYRVAVVRNLLGGMDHIEPFVKFATEHPERIPPLGSGRDVKHVLVDAFAVELWRKLGGFDTIDANHDGVITEPEIAAALARVTREAPSHITATLMMHAIDTNGDSVITPSEHERGTKG